MDEQYKEELAKQPQELEITELDDKDLEGAAGGLGGLREIDEGGGNNNCNCTNNPC